MKIKRSAYPDYVGLAVALVLLVLGVGFWKSAGIGFAVALVGAIAVDIYVRRTHTPA